MARGISLFVLLLISSTFVLAAQASAPPSPLPLLQVEAQARICNASSWEQPPKPASLVWCESCDYPNSPYCEGVPPGEACTGPFGNPGICTIVLPYPYCGCSCKTPH